MVSEITYWFHGDFTNFYSEMTYQYLQGFPIQDKW